MGQKAKVPDRHDRLTACVVAALALATPFAASAASTWTVNTCDQGYSGSGKTGTLRYAAANAASGDTINMTALPCSTISLTTGSINFSQPNLTINGPGKDKLTILGKFGGYIRIFAHTGSSGTLTINDLSMAYGRYSGLSATGGCIFSSGSLSINRVSLHKCGATSGGVPTYKGGAIYAAKNLTFKYSEAANNLAGYGGAIYTKGNLLMTGSAITANLAITGGGLFVYGNTTVAGSVIAGNTANNGAGGIVAYNRSSSGPGNLKSSIINSTISGNAGPGLYTNSGYVYLRNATIAFNESPGVWISDAKAPVAVTMQSSLIANNGASSGIDLQVPDPSSLTLTFSGANNLVRKTLAAVPPDTLKNVCPLLGPLRNNGGLAQTHALLSHSPGIDQGNNNTALTWDQRGSPFARVSGSFADIGAYEVQQNDIVFNAGFDGCP
ncbi:MAG: right-handed parallel beta-helix repeat-containing protein [Proteobacteria bacterium]|nr:right-handed parallel beta-helix repeat-containing protein [Pseudomonadota bacterium]